ncbi:MAG: EamA family transporter [Prochloraceae cyanobacterium]
MVVLIGAFSFALFSVLTKKIQEEDYTTTVLYFLGGTILSTLSMFLFSKFSFPSIQEIVPVILNGAFINGVSYILWLKALHLIPASLAAILVFFTPVLATFFIILFFNEPFIWSNITGLFMVLIAGFLANKAK